MAREQPMDVQIRWMIRRDMTEVMEIERTSFEYPWTEQDFIGCLRQRNCIGMVAEHDERVVGFMVYELHKDALHVLNLAVDSRYRRRRVGFQMMTKLVSKLSYQRRSRILLTVRECNLPAQLWLRRLGVPAVSVLRDYYEESSEDAYLFCYTYQDARAAGLRRRWIAGQNVSH